MLFRSYALALLGCLFLVGNAHAIADFSSLDGSLFFENFDLTPELEETNDFNIQAIDFGFTITFEDHVLSSFHDHLLFIYDVRSLGGPIIGATLSFEVSGDGLAQVTENYFELPKVDLFPELCLTVANYDISEEGDCSDSSGTFGVPLNHLEAEKDIQILTPSVRITSITQTYENAVPEPTALVLFGLGATATGFAITRRKAS